VFAKGLKRGKFYWISTTTGTELQLTEDCQTKTKPWSEMETGAADLATKLH
jgi:hypothetical protein